MSITAKKKAAMQPIEKLLKNNMLLATDPSTIKDAVCRLKELKQAYIQQTEVGNNVLRLSALNKK
ncbi:hypothetical protein [Nibribacter koreensis]|uniref:Uncharacterized protein n=1 Tax=Nibribacter koreensis TaxID=1084519 RepID=A0ABP8FFS0_9BACT